MFHAPSPATPHKVGHVRSSSSTLCQRAWTSAHHIRIPIARRRTTANEVSALYRRTPMGGACRCHGIGQRRVHNQLDRLLHTSHSRTHADDGLASPVATQSNSCPKRTKVPEPTLSVSPSAYCVGGWAAHRCRVRAEHIITCNAATSSRFIS